MNESDLLEFHSVVSQHRNPESGPVDSSCTLTESRLKAEKNISEVFIHYSQNSTAQQTNQITAELMKLQEELNQIGMNQFRLREEINCKLEKIGSIRQLK